MPIRVFEYGLRAPTVNADMVMDQMHKAHRYRNLLTELEHARRRAAHDIMAAHPDMAPLDAELTNLSTLRDAARGEILKTRSRTRSRSESAEQRGLAKDLGAKIRTLRQQIRELRKSVAAAVKPQLDVVEAESRQRVRDARAVCGVYWGTYLLQESDADRARQEITPPKFRGWRGEGRVSVQLQKGLSIEEVFDADTQLHIQPVEDAAHDIGVRRGDRRRARRTRLDLRIGSDASRKPIWASWPLVYHRPLPPGSQIKIATVSRRRHDCRSWKWFLHITVDIPDAAVRRAPTDGIVALNLGFCQRPDGTLRAGYMVGDDGAQEEIPVLRSVIDAVGKSDSIRSIRDKNMDAMKAAMGAWLATVRTVHENLVRDVTTLEASNPWDSAWARVASYITMGGPAMPAWFAERAAYLHLWRSADRFRQLAFRWRQNRFPGDEGGFLILEGGPRGSAEQQASWRHRDEHLERYESGMRHRALLRRRESYRVVAARMAMRYRTLLLDDTDLRDFQRSPPPESEDVEITQVKRNRGLAAGSELRTVLINAFGPDRVVKISPSTRTCHACGVINTWDRLVHPQRSHVCTSCGAQWDQDANACLNMIREHLQALESPPVNHPEAPVRAPRSQRLRAARQGSRTAPTRAVGS